MNTNVTTIGEHVRLRNFMDVYTNEIETNFNYLSKKYWKIALKLIINNN